MVEYTHGFPEWIKNQPPEGGCKTIPLDDLKNPIPLDDLLEATGLIDKKEEILANERAETAMEHILG